MLSRSRIHSPRPRRALLVVFVAAGLLSFLLSPALSGWARAAADKVVVTLGADLDSAQRKQMLDLFKVDADKVTVLQVTNAEERQYLEGAVPDKQIGTRAISSAYVHIKDDGSGVKVQTKHITYVTPRTYANALVTAGVADADIYAAAPFDVSGTAALTGIFKAFEEATGKEIPDQAKSVATEEMVGTAQVGEEVGNADAIARLIEEAKKEIAERGLKDPAAIREVVIRIAADVDINLTSEQADQLVKILVAVQGLHLDVNKIQSQLKDFQDSIGLTDAQAQGIWESIKGFFHRVWQDIFG